MAATHIIIRLHIHTYVCLFIHIPIHEPAAEAYALCFLAFLSNSIPNS